MRPTKALINISHYDKNIAGLRSLIGLDTAFMAVVKANAYGHGMYQTALQAVKSGAAWLGVALPEEGAELREKGISCPVLVLGDISPEQCKTVLQYDLAQTIPSMETALFLNETANRFGKKVKAHIKLDTGMGRIGFHTMQELVTFIDALPSMEGIEPDGAFTHLATSDEADSSFTGYQIETLECMLQTMKERGIRLNWIHASNSAGVFQYQNANYNLVRCGISTYGYYPSSHVKEKASIDLLPVLRWETGIVYVKSIHAGETVSYGRTYTADSSRRVATLPVGYADGYRRTLSNKASVLVCGKRAPIIGRVCMDQMMIDITHIPEASVGSSVVLLGEQGTDRISADELADLCGTISYEILTSISERVPRVYLYD